MQSCFFLGANTPGGFVGYMPESYAPRDGWRVYILKGGPGTGKSTFMRRVEERVTAAADCDVQEILCSSDPGSLDGVLFLQLKTAIFDGTAPHVLEPRYWGVTETVADIGGCVDTAALRPHAREIMEATDTCRELHGRCRQFLTAAAAMLADSRRTALACTDTDKVTRTAARIAGREFRGHGAGREQRRFLSAVTPEGEMVLYSTLQALCPRLYVVEDDYGAAGGLLLEELRSHALAAGQEIITCPCPLAPHDKIDHLLLPASGVGFTLSNPFHRADFPAYRRVHAARFTNEEALRQKRQRLAFDRRAARELLGEAAELAGEAKAVHDRLERFSVAATDFAAVDALRERITAEILRKIDDK